MKLAFHPQYRSEATSQNSLSKYADITTPCCHAKRGSTHTPYVGLYYYSSHPSSVQAISFPPISYPYLHVHTQFQSYLKLELHPSDKLSNHFTPAGGAALNMLMLSNLVVQGNNCNVMVKLLAHSSFGNCSCIVDLSRTFHNITIDISFNLRLGICHIKFLLSQYPTSTHNFYHSWCCCLGNPKLK